MRVINSLLAGLIAPLHLKGPCRYNSRLDRLTVHGEATLYATQESSVAPGSAHGLSGVGDSDESTVTWR